MAYKNPTKTKPDDKQTVLILLGTDYDKNYKIAVYSQSRDSYSCSNGAYSDNEYHDKNYKHTSNAYRVLGWKAIEQF